MRKKKVPYGHHSHQSRDRIRAMYRLWRKKPPYSMFIDSTIVYEDIEQEPLFHITGFDLYLINQFQGGNHESTDSL